MERLSNIIRTTQGSQTAANQRFPQQFSPQGPRPPVRRPLPEQSGRLGVSSRTTGLYSTRPGPTPRIPPSSQGEQWEEPVQSSTHPLSRVNYGSQDLPHTPRRYTEQPPQGDYYPEEEHSTVIPADIQEEWGDDTAGMRYGDWESAPAYSHASHYLEEEYALPTHPQDTNPVARPPAQEIRPVPQRLMQSYSRNNSLATRELSRVAPENTRLPASGEARGNRLPAVSSQLTPTPPGQLTRQRTTQPLTPQRMARLPAEMQQRAPETASRGRTEDITVYVPAPYNNPIEVCPICKGAGYLRQDVPYGHPGFGKPVQCECKQKDLQARRRLQIQETSNLLDLAQKRFTNFDASVSQGVREAYQIAREYAQDPYGWLVLIGKVGSGKTHLAAAIANQYMETGAPVLFTTVIDLLDHLRSTFAPSSEIVYDQLFSRMKEAALLVLDDLGAQQSSPWANEKLFQLLNYRYNLKIPTVITTNIRSEYIEERIRSRMMDVSFVTTVVLNQASDYRPRNPRRS